MGLTATEPDRRQIKPVGVLLVQIACTLARKFPVVEQGIFLLGH
jgi:hypothetical protein